MAEELTAGQRLAVENRGGTLLVSAAAGSGKTKVLVDRLMRYLTDPVHPAELDEFLIITYTKAAASELRGKIAAKLTERIAQEPENRHLLGQMQRLFLTKISTVHGFCGDVLREYAYRLELASDFRVAEENECRQIREAVLGDLLERAYARGDDPDFQAFVDSQGVGRDDRLVPSLIERVYDSARCHLDPEGWLEKCLTAAETEDLSDAGQTVWGKALMAEFFSWLDCQIDVLRRYVRWTQGYPELQKTGLVLSDALNQLETLRRAETWDEIAHFRPQFAKLLFPRKNDPDPETSDRVRAIWKACREGLTKKLRSFDNDSQQIFADLEQSRAAGRGLVALVREFGRDYAAAKKRKRVLDFSDLEHRTLDLLLGKSRTTPTSVAREVGRRYREVLVDEYQDSNAVQDAIFRALTEEKQNCFLVGDVKQSIYQFRLADPEIFLEKYSSFVPAATAQPGQGRKVFLSDNFRSGGEVIEAVNHVFRSCMRPSVGGLQYGDDEALREGIPHPPLPDAGTELYVMESGGNAYAREAAFVAERMETMLREGTLVRGKEGLRPVRAEDMVILLRAPGSCGGAFRKALEARGIPCAFRGGGDLLQSQEIGVFRDLLRIIRNPRQDIPLLAVLASPVFGFTAEDLAAIRGEHPGGSVYDALVESTRPKAVAFLSVLAKLRREARVSSLTGLLESCLSLTRLDSVFAAMESGDVRQTNIRTFYQLAVSFESGGRKDMGQFLEHLDALEGKGLLNTETTAAAGCVTIMSIHKSKGLEFPVVFLCCLAHKFNTESQRAPILCHGELGLGLSVADTKNRVRYPSIAKRAIAGRMNAELVSEEMRVLYVAMTRARDRLIMTYCDKRPDKLLTELALRMDLDGGELLCREAGCPGEWVLMAALKRTDAGAFHALSGRPGETVVPEIPWKIAVIQEVAQITEEVREKTVSRSEPPAGTVEQLRQMLGQCYPYEAATHAPSKQTATGRKGRQKDEEAAQDTREPSHPLRTWRKPEFLERATQGKTVGSAIHAALQYIRYEACTDTEAVALELDRLEQAGFLTAEQRTLVPAKKIAALFATELGRKLPGGNCLREFKFSILDDGEHYGEGLKGEQVLLQGVVDCALIEEDGITVIDFKTDKTTRETLPQLLERYRGQVDTYAQALRRIFRQPIKKRYLYVFALEEFVEI